MKQADVVARGLGLPLAYAEYPGAPMVDGIEELSTKVRNMLAAGVIKGLTQDRDTPSSVAIESEPTPGSIVMNGTLDEIQEYFYRKLWTDGMPIIPPTREHVDAFLKFTDRDPNEVLRTVPQEGREVTTLAIAVTGCMSGCRPEYMPLLIAVIEAMCDPEFHIEHCGSANTTVGRVVRMFLRNICGYRIPPGTGDKGSIGFTFNVALAEDEDAAHEIGWPTYCMDQGFKSEDSVVAITPPTYSGGDEAIDHVQQFADVMGATFTYWSHTGMKRGYWHPLIVVGPSIARVIAREWSKDKVRKYLFNNVKVTVGQATHFAQMTSTPTFSLEKLVAEGTLPKDYHESDDPERLVRVFIHEAMTGILIAGDPGRNQSRGYMGNHDQGPPTSRKVVLPKNWDAMLTQKRT